ncbi:MAG: esterase/lipase family protein [Phycisphaerales bacterium]
MSLLVLIVSSIFPGCSSAPDTKYISEIYSKPAQEIGSQRVPVVVLPGILGSKIEDRKDGAKIWGAFTFGAVDVDKPTGARQFALPMEVGVPLSKLTDDGQATEVLDVLVADIGIFRGIKIGAYVNILQTLAVGKYRDKSLGESGYVDYGGLHYTCFQFAYDWRRDISEQSLYLHQQILESQRAVRKGMNMSPDEPVKIDVVAHSMGGLVLRYYLRYGPNPLPDDGSLPEITWEGAENVSRAFIVGSPSAGSLESLSQLVSGMNLNPIFPNYRPGIVGTLPAIYQLLPRTRHGLVRDKITGETIDIFDADVWERYQWGMMDPREDKPLRWLLPEVKDRSDRLRIAKDHLQKCLDRAQQFFQAIDAPATPPTHTQLHLFAGDSQPTTGVLLVDSNGIITVGEEHLGDGTVTRASALMDERVGQSWEVGLKSPIAWERIQFIDTDHLGLTRDPSFVNNLLFQMLESPRIDHEHPLFTK